MTKQSYNIIYGVIPFEPSSLQYSLINVGTNPKTRGTILYFFFKYSEDLFLRPRVCFFLFTGALKALKDGGSLNISHIYLTTSSVHRMIATGLANVLYFGEFFSSTRSSIIKISPISLHTSSHQTNIQYFTLLCCSRFTKCIGCVVMSCISCLDPSKPACKCSSFSVFSVFRYGL